MSSPPRAPRPPRRPLPELADTDDAEAGPSQPVPRRRRASPPPRLSANSARAALEQFASHPDGRGTLSAFFLLALLLHFRVLDPLLWLLALAAGLALLFALLLFIPTAAAAGRFADAVQHGESALPAPSPAALALQLQLMSRELGPGDYDALLALDEGDVGRGLTAEQLAGLPAHVVAGAAPAATCAVCLSDLVAGELARTLTCAHTFHAGCLDTWLAGHVSCPVCKREVV